MAVIAARRYKNGQSCGEISIFEPITNSGKGGGFFWIGLYDPTQEELSAVQRNFGLHQLSIDDAAKANQLPKLDIYGDQLFIVARTAEAAGDKVTFGETHIFVGPNFVISVRHGSVRAHAELRAQLESSPTLLKHGVDYVLHAILDFIIDGYLPIIESIADRVQEMENRALETFLGRSDVQLLFALRQQLSRFDRLLAHTSDLCARLGSADVPQIDPEARPYFSDVHDHVRRVQGRVSGLRDSLSSVFEASMLLEQQHQGIITRRLAAWGAILAVPTAIAGIYGMNFRHMPELELQFGYPIILGIILAICLVLYVRFKRSHWL